MIRPSDWKKQVVKLLDTSETIRWHFEVGKSMSVVEKLGAEECPFPPVDIWQAFESDSAFLVNKYGSRRYSVEDVLSRPVCYTGSWQQLSPEPVVTSISKKVLLWQTDVVSEAHFKEMFVKSLFWLCRKLGQEADAAFISSMTGLSQYDLTETLGVEDDWHVISALMQIFRTSNFQIYVPVSYHPPDSTGEWFTKTSMLPDHDSPSSFFVAGADEGYKAEVTGIDMSAFPKTTPEPHWQIEVSTEIQNWIWNFEDNIPVVAAGKFAAFS